MEPSLFRVCIPAGLPILLAEFVPRRRFEIHKAPATLLGGPGHNARKARPDRGSKLVLRIHVGSYVINGPQIQNLCVGAKATGKYGSGGGVEAIRYELHAGAVSSLASESVRRLVCGSEKGPVRQITNADESGEEDQETEHLDRHRLENGRVVPCRSAGRRRQVCGPPVLARWEKLTTTALDTCLGGV